MNTEEVNKALAEGDVSTPGVLPKLDELKQAPAVFTVSFGLAEIPQQPGVLLVRGARQYGKSTWMQQQIKQTIRDFGPASAYHLNAEEFPNAQSLAAYIRSLAGLYRADASVRRLFIDEITALNGWEKAIKTLADAGELRNILLITTGSSAADLRHGAERLPGRKGQLPRTCYIFPPISYSEFCRVFEAELPPSRLIPAYILTGGAPPACNALLSFGYIPDYIIELVRDWVYGEFAATGRSRGTVVSLFECFYRFAGTPVGQSKLARETGLANNSVAAGYLDLFADLLSLAFVYPWDASRKRLARRRPCKFHMTNLLAATAWHPKHPRTPADIQALP